MGARALGRWVIKRPGCGTVPSAAPVSLRAASHTMSVTSSKARPSLTQEILSYLGLANKVGLPGLDGSFLLHRLRGYEGQGCGKGAGPGPHHGLRGSQAVPGGGQTSAAPLLLQTAAWGTLGTLRTFLSFSVDKDVQRLLRAIAGQGRPLSLCI